MLDLLVKPTQSLGPLAVSDTEHISQEQITDSSFVSFIWQPLITTYLMCL